MRVELGPVTTEGFPQNSRSNPSPTRLDRPEGPHRWPVNNPADQRPYQTRSLRWARLAAFPLRLLGQSPNPLSTRNDMSAEDWSAAPESRMGHILTQWAGNDAVVSSPHRPAHLGQGREKSHDRAYLRVTACDCHPDRSKREDPASPHCRGRAPRLPVRPDPHARPRRRRRLVSSLPATDLAVTAAVADRVSLLPHVALSAAFWAVVLG